MPRTPVNEAVPCAAHAGTAEAMPNRLEGQRLMANLASPNLPDLVGAPDAAVQDRDAVIAGTVRVFRSVGVTSGDLRSWASWCPVLGELADAMDARAGAS